MRASYISLLCLCLLSLTFEAIKLSLKCEELKTFESLKPDIVVTVADRFETMATAIAASYMNIPLAHTQGGEVTGSIDESVRHAITKLSHLHFAATEKSRERVIKMGEDTERVFNTGCSLLLLYLELILPNSRGAFKKAFRRLLPFSSKY